MSLSQTKCGTFKPFLPFRGYSGAVHGHGRRKELEDYKGMAKKRGLRTILCLKDTGNTVTAFDMLTGNVDETPVSAYGVREIL